MLSEGMRACKKVFHKCNGVGMQVHSDESGEAPHVERRGEKNTEGADSFNLLYVAKDTTLFDCVLMRQLCVFKLMSQASL